MKRKLIREAPFPRRASPLKACGDKLCDGRRAGDEGFKRSARRKLFVFWMALLFCVLFPPLLSAQPTRLVDIESSSTSDSARLAFALTQPTTYQVFMLANPSRLIIDFVDTRSQFNLNQLTITGVKSVRSGRPKPGTFRIVLDLERNVRFKYFFEKNRNQLVLDLYYSSANVSRALPVPAETVSTPVVTKVEKPSRNKTIIVVIDPGHGGKDSGAVGENNTQEKNVVLGISRQLAALINEQPGMRAVLTRDGDYFVPLRDRLKLARKGKGDLFVAIHADSYFNNSASGASIYALSRRGATSEAARWLAKRENYSELGGVDLGELGDQSYLLRSVLIDLAQTATITDSLRLGNMMLSSLDDITRLHYSRVEQAPFVVLKSPDIPSVLVETGFISNTKEEMRLRDPAYQRKLAQALFNGLHRYVKQYSASF